jgi:GT2 family glycosyltransferase
LVLILNPDIELPEDFVSRMVEVWSSGKFGALVPQLVDRAGNVERSVRRFPSILTEFARSVGMDHFTSRGTVIDLPPRYTGPVEQPPGACVMLAAEGYHELGGFDSETFPLYFEDVDICLRIWRGLGPIWYSSEIRAVHHREGTARRYRSKSIFWIETGRRAYIRKHFPARYRALSLYFATVGCMLRAALFSIAGLISQDRDVRERARGYRAAVMASLTRSDLEWRNRML